ncbi:PIN domain nuclease, a component of toxin-antitoxin system (PIN domain) [Modestobacter sp. DSM 44400]|uniref:type II toxin-antitoxin system VapC family toxin n=1 Tax=Modestobacter sp. DSM 44400 TaxID=1550230 RepID=UPI0008965BD3|nr:type II toxin-antitoxin system VapC family toxin [Modestobacter sp. DSM 44400]SDX65685.1 PIN domain nuclease, a component of toxin-antitoxin system (PIN domain) [Modestobacter sp. DSM 44400]
MRLLLDTNALLWLVAGDRRLGAQARSALPTLPTLPTVLEQAAVQRLGIEDAHLVRLQELPWQHRDPFDRLLIAQALAEGLAVSTADQAFSGYGISVRDARA